jgi:hypothetical protein
MAESSVATLLFAGMRMGCAGVLMRFSAVFLSCRRMFLSAVVSTALMMMSSLTMMMGRCLVMSCGVMMVFTRRVFGIDHCYLSAEAPTYKLCRTRVRS